MYSKVPNKRERGVVRIDKWSKNILKFNKLSGQNKPGTSNLRKALNDYTRTEEQKQADTEHRTKIFTTVRHFAVLSWAYILLTKKGNEMRGL